MKNILLIILVFTTSYTYAQKSKTDPKKVVVIEKKDENGKITETRKEGVEAEEMLKSMSPEDIEMINVEKSKSGNNIIKIKKSKSTSKVSSSDDNGQKKEIEITSEIKDGKTKEKYKIITKDGDGEKVMEWDGDGEMPADMAKELEHVNINKNWDGENMTIDVEVDDDDSMPRKDKKVMIFRKDYDNKGRKMEWKEREMAEGSRRTEWRDRDDNRFSFRNAPMPFNFNNEKPNTNKVSLGVMIEDTDQGVVITDIVEGSAAVAAGLRRGDVILKINDKYVFTSNGLLDTLNPFNPNEKVKIRYIRDGKEKSGDAVLKARK